MATSAPSAGSKRPVGGAVLFAPAGPSLAPSSEIWRNCREAHLSAEPARPQTPSWLPRPHADQGRPAGSRTPPREGPQTPVGLTVLDRHPPCVRRGGTAVQLSTLKKRPEFQRVRGGGRCSTPAFVLEGKVRADGLAGGPRFGFTVTKKLGGAVQRNRIRRRLKAAIGAVATQHADPRFDYVIIAREAALEREFALLQADLVTALGQVNKGPRESGSSRPHRKPPGPNKAIDRN